MSAFVLPPASSLLKMGASPKVILSLVLVGLLSHALVKVLRNQRIEREFAEKYGAVRLVIRNTDFFGIRRFLSLSRAFLEHKIMEYIIDDFKAYGNTYGTTLLGQRNPWTIEPENIKTILATKFNDYGLGTRYDAFLPLLGEGIFTLDNEGWAHSRAILRPQFSREQVSDIAKLEPHVRNLLSCLDRSQSESCDIQELFYRMTLDSATEFLFGESVHSLLLTPEPGNKKNDDISVILSDAGKQGFTYAFNYCQEVLAIRAIMQSFCWLLNPKAFRDATAVAHRFVDYYVQKALDAYRDGPAKIQEITAGRYVFLYSLVEETQSPKALRDQSLNILLAGRDTVAGLLSWTVYLLARHPRVFEKLRAEIIETFGDKLDSPGKRRISFESLKSTLYLRYVLNEVLRLYPSAPLNYRTALRDTVLPVGGGPDGKSPVLIRKGDTVVYSVYALHRRRDFFGDDAEEFRPERWAEGNIWTWEYLPFNGGPRICLGQQYALTEAGYTIVRLLQEFDTLESTEEPEPAGFPLKKMMLTMSKSTGVNVRLHKSRDV
ncbi:cytochrome P450 [Lipomyces tetrasporus]|uniref:Cytochrome P450 n=1 Tax=Lipomyces tetrasporus TaxID=54092 RepID=A0AAD7VRK4_9ASCO|nr:cytochrome P450 [Lipomyces tetrasporus]KAJ8099011.1 cytochrome P450 [Lipomyces tetrasporus]